jgi:hypothetical protein
MRVEVGDHAAHRRFDERAVIYRLDVFLAHALQNFGQQAGLLPREALFFLRERALGEDTPPSDRLRPSTVPTSSTSKLLYRNDI